MQSIEACIPKLLVVQDPPRDLAQWLWGKRQGVVAAVPGAVYEPCSLENSHVLAESREGHREGFGDLRDAGWSSRKALDDGAAGGVGNRGGHTANVGVMLNHMVHYIYKSTFRVNACANHKAPQGPRNRIDSN
ncbi:MAG: hypothetical protein WAN23_11395 [Candidatus Acidiferrales bacterium]